MSESRDALEVASGESVTGETVVEAPGPRAVAVARASERARPYRVLSVTVFALLGLLAMAGVKSYRDLAAAQDIEGNLLREISETKLRIRALSEYIDRIENDPATLERLAREELGMVREGDLVIVLPEDSDLMEASPTALED